MSPLVTELELPVLDYTDPALKGERFHDVMRERAAEGWLCAGPLGVCVLDRESCEFFLRTRAAEFPGQKIAELFGIDDGPLREEIDRNVLHINGPAHARLRQLVNPSFTPRAADRWRPAMRGFLEALWAGVAPAGRCDFVEAFAKPYPSQVIAAVMGAPQADAPRLHDWSNWIQRQFDGPSLLADRARIEQAVEEFYVWAGELLAAKRREPGEDLVSTLLAAEAEGDRLSDVETLHLVLNVLIGGVDTTQSQLAQAVRLLAADPEQWALLRSDPGTYAARAVDEVLRFEPITPFTARITTEEIVHRDVTFPEGTVVMVASFAANRDVAGGDAADRFDLRAERGRERPLTFGAGVHFCLGSNLARAEMEEGLRFLGAHISELALDGEPRLGTVQGIYGLDALPIRWRT